MVQLLQSSTPADPPRVVRIFPNRSALWLGAGAGLVLLAVLLFLGPEGAGSRSGIAMAGAWQRPALVICALTAIGCGLRLVAQLPIIEASELGIAIWFHGPYRRPFFVPWSRVRAVVLTRVRPANSADRASVRNALGIELIADNHFPGPPQSAGREVPIDGAARADLAWSSRSIGGDVRRWARLLQQMKPAYADPTPSQGVANASAR